jgi:hypothetical protein
MMSYTTSAAWNRHVFSPCYTEPDPFRGAVLSGRITTVAMSRSGQLNLRCTVEPNCSGMSAWLAGASVTRDRALDTCEPSCVPVAAMPLFIPVVHTPLDRGVCGSTGALLSRRRCRGHVAASEHTSTWRWGPELRNTWQHQSSPLWEAGSEAEKHMVAP